MRQGSPLCQTHLSQSQAAPGPSTEGTGSGPSLHCGDGETEEGVKGAPGRGSLPSGLAFPHHSFLCRDRKSWPGNGCYLCCCWPGCQPPCAAPETGQTCSTSAWTPNTTRQSQAPRTSCMARCGCSVAAVGEGTGSDREEDLRVVREEGRGQTAQVLIIAEKVKVRERFS